MGDMKISENKITRRQHYIPRAYLKSFAISNKKTAKVYVAFANDKNTKTISIEDICCRSYLYDQIAIDPESEERIFVAPNEIENSFIDIEGRYATIVSNLKNDLQNTDEYKLTTEEIDILQQFISLLIFRNPIFVHISNCMVNMTCTQDSNHIRHLKEKYPDIPESFFTAIFANELLKMLISQENGLFTCAMASTMENSQICLFRAQQAVFITSDMPVVNIYGERDGREYDLMGMPITPELFLAFVDTDQCIPKVVELDDCSVKRINSRQVNRPGRILISNQKNILAHVDFSMEVEREDDEWLYEKLNMDKEIILSLYRDIRNTKEIKQWR